ncbi:unnamed protein product [Kuraishia capsulata CBS 1993]|uniref:Class II aldolase/adducin N-terminal domain-containing protein n=1 Tax=Kuraishia capsulata CBS 1993 TaxID=1382522 RepID=W6MLR7_9ASCO|nr:uncharacterized protein KUCA_T00003442001 [Kuraishia capsulata CBS 1993]CDK27464.1 unnamed protein product [Kuraishia capsulata CBS 1993]
MSATRTETQVPTSLQVTTERGYKITERGAHNISMGFGPPYPIPQFEDKYKEREWALEHMAAAFRAFARKGYDEGSSGHISIRDPVDPTTFWINPLGRHFALLKASDMVQVDEDGNVIGGNQHTINSAGFAIHSALHKARPDVNAACHCHSVYGKAYGVFGKPLEMLNQDVCTLYENHAVYSDFGGVAVEKKEGEAIASAVGDTAGAILQNHGLITVGYTVDEAAYLFMLMEKSCEIQLLADAAASNGLEKKYIGDEEAAYTRHIQADRETLYMDFQSYYELELELSNGAFLIKKET